MKLTGKQRRYLRSLGHNLHAVVQLGKNGLTKEVMGATDAALTTHELVKVRRGSECPATRAEIAEALSSSLEATKQNSAKPIRYGGALGRRRNVAGRDVGGLLGQLGDVVFPRLVEQFLILAFELFPETAEGFHGCR